jgi:hypothetical protein
MAAVRASRGLRGSILPRGPFDSGRSSARIEAPVCRVKVIRDLGRRHTLAARRFLPELDPIQRPTRLAGCEDDPVAADRKAVEDHRWGLLLGR